MRVEPLSAPPFQKASLLLRFVHLVGFVFVFVHVGVGRTAFAQVFGVGEAPNGRIGLGEWEPTGCRVGKELPPLSLPMLVGAARTVARAAARL